MDRKGYVGASDAPAARGVSPYKEDTPARLWAVKTGRIDSPDLSGNERIQLGHEMQSAILQLFGRRTGLAVQEVGDDVQATHSREAYIRARTDGLIAGQSAVVDAKFYGEHKMGEFGESGTDEVPLYVAVQGAHEAVCFGVETVYFAVLFGNAGFRHYKLQFSPDVLDAHVQAIASFWSFVATDTPPPAKRGDDVPFLFPSDSGLSVRADDRVMALHAAYHAIKERYDAIEAQLEQVKDSLRLAVGSASQIVDARGKPLVSYKLSAESYKFDSKKLAAEYPAIYEACKVPTKGSRRLLIK